MTDRLGLIQAAAEEGDGLGRSLFDVVPRLGEGVGQQLNHICEVGDRATMSLEYEVDNGEIGFYEVTVAPSREKTRIR